MLIPAIFIHVHSWPHIQIYSWAPIFVIASNFCIPLSINNQYIFLWQFPHIENFIEVTNLFSSIQADVATQTSIVEILQGSAANFANVIL